jgi:ATP-dependent exoDNAse (exonuclease V) alpha subunit
MPVICLENCLGTKLVNGALCCVVNVVLDEIGKIPAAVLVVAAKSKEEAVAKVDGNHLQQLLADKVMVPLVPVKRQGRKAIPYALVWCTTVHKVQGATIDRVVLNVVYQVAATVLYTEQGAWTSYGSCRN